MISIIITTYNRAYCLGEAIQSVLDQDYFVGYPTTNPFELLVIDNGSTDKTQELVKSFGKPVSYFFIEQKGVSVARNLGLSHSQEKYIAFLDSDDIWEKNKITSQMNVMKTLTHTMVCYTEEIWIRHGKFVNPKKKHKKYSGWIFDKVLPLCLLSLSSAMFRREVFETIGVFDERLPACEDYDLGIRLAHRYPFHLIPKPLIVKRGGHADQLSRQYWGMDRFRIKALEKALKLDLTPDQERLVKEEIVKKCEILVNGFRKRNNKESIREYLNLIEIHRP